MKDSLNKVLLLAGQLEEKRQLKDGVVKFAVVCNEMPAEKLAELFALKNSFVYIAVKPENFLATELAGLEEIKADSDVGKTPSKRLRNSLYVLWKSEGETGGNFEIWYINYMEKIINHVKNKIPVDFNSLPDRPY